MPLEALDLDDTLSFVRGFMLFSMLANLAEDRQGRATEPMRTWPRRCSSWPLRASAPTRSPSCWSKR